MSDLITKDWNYGEAAQLDLREPDKSEAATCNMDDLIQSYIGPKWTLWHNHTPVLCGGYHFDGITATLWGLTSHHGAQHPKAMTQTMIKLTHHAHASGIVRAQALVLEGNEKSCHWLQRLGGFQYEGLLHHYGPDGKNRHMLAHIGPIP